MTAYPPPAWTFANANGELADCLWLSQDSAKKAAIKAYFDDGIDYAPFEWRPSPARADILEQVLYHGGEPTGFRVLMQPWVNGPREQQCAWHEIVVHDKPDSFTGSRVEGTCPDECRHLPPGAVCWYIHENFRPQWPTEPGRYRIRPYHHVMASRGDFSGVEVEFQIQTWGGAVPCWFDERGIVVAEIDEDMFR